MDFIGSVLDVKETSAAYALADRAQGAAEVAGAMDPAVVQMIARDSRIAYVIADASLRVLEVGGATNVFEQDGGPVAGGSLLDLLPELIGSERVLDRVLAEDLPRFQLPHVNRPASDGSIRYLTLTVLPYDCDPARRTLLIVVTDASEHGQYAQMLNQQRNELSLLRGDLTESNAQLDFLLRHYIPTEVADALLEQRLSPEQGGELRNVTVLFADLRSYTQVAEQLPPSRTMEMLNEYLGIACSAIAATGGTIAQFMGDTVMALFNAPDDQLDHAWRAVQAGLKIQRAVEMHQARRAADLRVYFGVGIHSGPAIVGNTGAHWRYDYSAIGDTTNVAFRISSVAGAREVWIGPDTYEQLRGRVTAAPLEPMRFKGKGNAVPLYRVLALEPEPSAKSGRES